MDIREQQKQSYSDTIKKMLDLDKQLENALSYHLIEKVNCNADGTKYWANIHDKILLIMLGNSDLLSDE